MGPSFCKGKGWSNFTLSAMGGKRTVEIARATLRGQAILMARFEVDRLSLPGAWDAPLLFNLRRGEQSVVAEVQRDAAVDFAWSPSASGIAMFFASDRIDDFLLNLEEAVERLYDEAPRERLTVDWSALYPNGL